LRTRIKTLRKSLKLTQTEFGKKLGLSLQAVQDWEYGRNKIPESSLLLIENTFNINPRWLREGEGEMFKIPEPEPGIDFTLLEGVIAETLRGLKALHIDLSPENAAGMIVYIYKTIQKENKDKITNLQTHMDKIFTIAKFTRMVDDYYKDIINNEIR